MDAEAYIAAISTERPQPFRFQCDRDIGGGYMHSGYPIMTGLDVTEVTLDPTPGKWGHYHEVGRLFLGLA